jgi:hypothetical protein
MILSTLSIIKELPNDPACKAFLAKIKWQYGVTCMKSQTIDTIVTAANT